jgi:acetylornithine/N-succinyldiaminopimelate aminotransferase
MGNAVLDVLEEESILNNVKNMSAKLKVELINLSKKYPEIIDEVRGLGLMLGIKLQRDPKEFIAQAFENKLLVVGASENTIRILPPLNITSEDIKEAITKLNKTCIDELKKIKAI